MSGGLGRAGLSQKNLGRDRGRVGHRHADRATLTVPHRSCHLPPSSGAFSQGAGIVSVSAMSLRRADLSHFFLGANRARFRLTETDHVA